MAKLTGADVVAAEMAGAPLTAEDRERRFMVLRANTRLRDFNAHLTQVESRLEGLLDEVRRIHVQAIELAPSDPGAVTPVRAAGMVTHEVLWRVANLDLAGLARVAAELEELGLGVEPPR